MPDYLISLQLLDREGTLTSGLSVRIAASNAYNIALVAMSSITFTQCYGKRTIPPTHPPPTPHPVFAVWEDGELVMNGSMIAENKILQVLGFTLVSKGTWLAHVDSIVKEAQQRLGANS